MAYGTINAEQLTTQSGYTLGAGNASSFKNRIINGAMVIDQRNAGASVTPTDTGGGTYVIDRFYARVTQASKLSYQRSTVAPEGFTNSLALTSLSAYSVTSSDHFAAIQAIEGFNVADLGWGTANAKPITFSFKVRSSLTGTFGGFVSNSDVNRCYVFSYTINEANTFEDKTVTIFGDTSGTWFTNNGVGLYLSFSVGAGSSVTSTAGSWGSTFYRSVTGQTSLVGTNGATFYITGVQLEVGTVATSFDFRDYGTEFFLCQRYYQTIDGGICASGNDSSTSCGISVSFPVVMRSSPSAGLTAPLYITRFGSADFAQSSASVSISAGGGRVTNKGVSLNFNNFTGLPLNTPFPIIASPDPTIGKITLSSEL